CPSRAEDLRDDELLARDPSLRRDLLAAADGARAPPYAQSTRRSCGHTDGLGAVASDAAVDPLRARPHQAPGDHPHPDLGWRPAGARSRALAPPDPHEGSPRPPERAPPGGAAQRPALPDRAGAGHQRSRPRAGAWSMGRGALRAGGRLLARAVACGASQQDPVPTHRERDTRPSGGLRLPDYLAEVGL